MKNYFKENWFGMLIMLFFISIFVCIGLTACSSETEETVELPRFYALDIYDDENGRTHPIKIYVDTSTRVQYIYNVYDGGMCPLIDAEGKPLLYEGEFIYE
jgi:hypothetical protein